MSSSSWWARKLGTEPQQPAPQWSPAPVQTVPGHAASYPATGPAYQGPPPMGAQTQHIQVTKDNVVALTGLWQGGQGTKTETQRCPQCGSSDYFSRANVSGSKMVNTNSGTMAHAAPHCFDCGHNGMYTQAGGQ